MQVLAYDAEKTWYSASETVSATTYQSPHDVELLSKTSSSINVAWVSSADDSVLQHSFEYTKVSLHCRVMSICITRERIGIITNEEWTNSLVTLVKVVMSALTHPN